MARPISMRKYLQSIDGLLLPERFSEVIERFVDYVVEAHSWYKRFPLDGVGSVMPFNFFVGPGPLIESEGSLHERVHDKFQFLKYGVPTYSMFDVKDQIPREIYDAGLVVVPGKNFEGSYKSDQSKRILVVGVGNMLQAVEYYRERHHMTIVPSVGSELTASY